MASQAVSKNTKIGGLDSIRFFAALWVVFAHRGLPPLLAWVSPGQTQLMPLGHIYDSMFNGQAAVVLFFIISGFSIHLPQTRGEPLLVPAFYARRLLRITIPWIVVDVLLQLTMPGAIEGMRVITWTLQCEVVYYLLYPLLLMAARKAGWMKITAIAYALSFLAIARFMPHQQLCGQGKIVLNSIIGLPTWLLGCVLAEQCVKQTASVAPRIWLWRAGMWIASAACYLLSVYTPVGMPWSLTAFGLLGYFYIRAEIAYYRSAMPVRLFERAGEASYSLYLTHYIPIWALLGFAQTHSAWTHWIVLMGAVFAVTFVFYRLVELPAHQFARKFRGAAPWFSFRRGVADAG